MRKKGFPSDEELQKEYNSYVNSEEGESHKALGLLPTFENFKEQKLIDFSNKFLQPKQSPKKWELNDGWEDTEEEPIQEVIDTQY